MSASDPTDQATERDWAEKKAYFYEVHKTAKRVAAMRFGRTAAINKLKSKDLNLGADVEKAAKRLFNQKKTR